MNEQLQQAPISLHTARACMADIRALARQFEEHAAEAIERQLLDLAESGETQALSRLLQVAAYNRVRLDGAVLARCLSVCERAVDTAPCLALTGEAAVPALLTAANDETLSDDQRVYAACFAAELSMEYELDPATALKALRKLGFIGLPRLSELMRADMERYLEQFATTGEKPPYLLLEISLTVLLPERPPPRVVGGDYTIRRPIPKLGRNEPCHCGSGLKYKKCCHAEDQALLRDASAYAGATRSELKAHPGLIDEPTIIEAMRAHELKTLDPGELGPNQLYAAYRRALAFGLRQLAFDMLLELEARPDEQEFDPGHFEDLIEWVLEAGDLELARRIRDHCGDDCWYHPESILFLFELLEHPEHFASLEQACRLSVCAIENEETRYDEPLVRLAHQCAPHYPALAVVLARAAIASRPEHAFDNEMLLDRIRELRLDLDRPQWDDPAEALFQWTDERHRALERERKEDEATLRLAKQLEATRTALDEKQRTLQEMAERVQEAEAELRRSRASGSGPAANAPPAADSGGESEKGEQLLRLRNQLQNLKAEIGQQQAQRSALRKALAEARRKLDALTASEAATDEPDRELATVEPSGRPLVPEYSNEFRSRCATLPPAHAAKTILAAGRFAAHDPTVWRETRAIERLPGHYRIRIGRDYRLLVHWLPGESLQVLDVIPRQGLEAWIKRRG